MSVLSILESKFKELHDEIVETEAIYECKRDKEEEIQQQIQDLTTELAYIAEEIKGLETKIQLMKTSENDMKNTYDNIVNSASMLLETMESSSYEIETNKSYSIEINDDDNSSSEDDLILND
jgi:chromosome segregation ATPase